MTAPPDLTSAIDFGSFTSGRVCTSDNMSMSCWGTHGGSGAGSTRGGWRQIGRGDFDGDGIDELVRRHCGDVDPCSDGNADRVVTYNVNHAGIRSTEELAREIAWFDASLVVVQEVDIGTKRNANDMAADLARLAGFAHYKFFKSNRYRGGDYGQLVLSRQPITDTKIIKLPDHADPTEWSEHYIAVAFKTGDRSVIATHIINDKWRNGVDLSETQKKQVDRLISEVKKRTPDVVMGDFNLTPTSSLYRRFVEKTGYTDVWAHSNAEEAITFPDLGGEPRRIDYIFARDPEPIICSRVPTLITSDHYPMIAGFDR